MIEAKVTGTADFVSVLSALPPGLRAGALRDALRAGGLLVRDAARGKAPTARGDYSMVRLGYRTPGLIRRRLSVRNSKLAARRGNVGVFINVRPAAGRKLTTRTIKTALGFKKRVQHERASQRGAKSPNDPFYWRFVNFPHRTRGGRTVAGVKFMEAGAARLGSVVDVIGAKLGPAVENIMQRKAKSLTGRASRLGIL